MHLPGGFLLPRLVAWLNYFRFDGTQYRSGQRDHPLGR